MSRHIPGLIVNQWLRPNWDKTKFAPAPPRGKPKPQYYVFSLNAYDLKKLSGIYRRNPTLPPAEDTGIQRRFMPQRSQEILRYIQDGFPLSRIDRTKLVDPSDETTLRMPGWIPTAIVANILVEGDKRGASATSINKVDLITIDELEDQHVSLIMPRDFESPDWHPPVHPIEIIDGQHRLWAMEEPREDEEPWPEGLKEHLKEFQLPVVAFHGLDRTWQAYLFYTINQLPKKIDQSLVFDLYPLLRDEGWLLRFEGPNIYRESRAQDLTILLWGHENSPWKDRILRVGGRVKGMVTQASFIRSLTASLIKRWHDDGRIGGFFGAPFGVHMPTINWGREQQAAFLIVAWQILRDAVTGSKDDWADALLNRAGDKGGGDFKRGKHTSAARMALFDGPETLIATDQGVRGFHVTLNDILVTAFREEGLDLSQWTWTRSSNHNDDNDAISDAISSLRESLPKTVALVGKIAATLKSFDWRISSAISPRDEAAFNRQAAYRGSGGYSLLRRNLLIHLRDRAKKPLSEYAATVLTTLKFDSEEDY